MDILIVGSIALDDVRTPAGEVKRALGGSAIYSSLAASYFATPGVVGVVGTDFSKDYLSLLTQHGIVTNGIETAAGATFHWTGYYEKDMGTAFTVDTQLNVFGSFAPKIPDGFEKTPFLFLANIDPVLQLQVLKTMKATRFVLLDTMNYWIETKRAELLAVLKQVTMVVVNDAEARQLSGKNNLLDAAEWIQQQGPQGVAIKKGEHGALIFWKRELAILPAFPLRRVVDPTGAGDTFAGGMIGSLAQMPTIDIASLQSAASIGTIMASFTVEDFSVKRLAALEWEKIQERHTHLLHLSHIKPFSLKKRG